MDNQAHIFKCPAIWKELKISCDISEVYTGIVAVETAQTLSKMLDIRNKILEKNNRKPDDWKVRRILKDGKENCH